MVLLENANLSCKLCNNHTMVISMQIYDRNCCRNGRNVRAGCPVHSEYLCKFRLINLSNWLITSPENIAKTFTSEVVRSRSIKRLLVQFQSRHLASLLFPSRWRFMTWKFISHFSPPRGIKFPPSTNYFPLSCASARTRIYSFSACFHYNCT